MKLVVVCIVAILCGIVANLILNIGIESPRVLIFPIFNIALVLLTTAVLLE